MALSNQRGASATCNLHTCKAPPPVIDTQCVYSNLALTLPQEEPTPGFWIMSSVSCTLTPAASASARPQVQSLHALRPVAPTSQSSAATAFVCMCVLCA